MILKMFNFFKRDISSSPNTILASQKMASKKKFDSRSLYKTKENYYFWLDSEKYLDKSIIEHGFFEKESTASVERIVKDGDVVLDIGANIGYYSVILSKLVGSKGIVHAFEPVKSYREVLKENLIANKIKNTKIYPFGFSDKKEDLDIYIGNSSATLHWVADGKPLFQEKIKLTTLDDFSKKNKLDRIDFIKIDVDGHEPSFLKGAWNTLEKFNPVILLEVNQENYLKAGYTVWDFYDLLKSNNYKIYNEENLQEFNSKREFLIKCANFSYSANIIISKKKIPNV